MNSWNANILHVETRNKSQAKEIKRLLIQKKIQVELTLMDDNNADKPGNKYQGMYDSLDFVLDPGVLHYCATESLMFKNWICERTSMRADC